MSSYSSLDLRSLETLEWEKIQKELANRTTSFIGKAFAEKHKPLNTKKEASYYRDRAGEAYKLLATSNAQAHLKEVSDPTEAFKHAEKGGKLKAEQIWMCCHFMEAISAVREEFFDGETQDIPLLKEDFKPAPKAPPVCKDTRKSVSSSGEILDTASKKLARSRLALVSKKEQLEGTLKSRVNDWYDGGLLQDKYYDVFDGRYVVPVKTESQSKVQGILLGKSRSSQSVFVEPTELNHANNEIKELELAIFEEEQRILKTLSQELGKFYSIYSHWVEPVTTLDLSFAIARLAKDWELHPSKPSHIFEVAHLFHPLLKLQPNLHIVNNHVSFNENLAGLIVSGPNTGGKTVLLKAVGLSACMANAGLFIAGAKNATLPHYKKIVAFIGDDQNISQGLSSFSAQILDLKKILDERKKTPMLILVDEILSSTDPEEASALAYATIEELVENGHHVLVTTHFSELSLRAQNHSRLQVAAMEFQDGKPSYKLCPNELGSSHAIDVAKSLGFPKSILQRAESFVSTAKQDYEAVKKALKMKEHELTLKAHENEHKLEKERRDLQMSFNEKQKTLEAKIEDFLEQAKVRVEETIHQLNERMKNYKKMGVTKNVKSKLTDLANQALGTLEDHDPTKKKKEARQPQEIRKNDYVWVKSLNRSEGKVIEIDESIALLQVGNFRVKKPLTDLEIIHGKKQSKLTINYAPETGGSSKLDLRGKRYEDAMLEAEKYLDHAFRSGNGVVTIVTGHGTGALKQGIRKLLERLPYVVNFERAHEVDDGAVRIELENA